MNYQVQAATFDSEGRYRPLDPKEVTAETSLEAAQKVCGPGLVEHGPHDRLAATVWERATGNPYPIRFYRAQ